MSHDRGQPGGDGRRESGERAASGGVTHLAGTYLAFGVGRDRLAVGVLSVREILRLEPITRVPGTPPFVRGVFNLRGRIVPVVDLRLGLELEAAEDGERTCIVVMETELGGTTVPFGAVVDEVHEVAEFAESEVELPPGVGAMGDARGVAGIGKKGGVVTVLLDPARLLTSGELRRVGELGAAVSGEPSRTEEEIESELECESR